MQKFQIRIKGTTPYLQKFNSPYKDKEGNYYIPNFQMMESLLEGTTMLYPHLSKQVMKYVKIKPEYIKLEYRNVSDKKIEGEKFLMFEGWGAEFELHLAEGANDLADVEKEEIEEIIRMWGGKSK